MNINLSYISPTYRFNPISASVENDAPTKLVIQFPEEKLLTADNFSIAGFTIDSAVWTDSILTLTLSTSVINTDTLVLTFIPTGQVLEITNNVTSIPVTPEVPVLVSADIYNNKPRIIKLFWDNAIRNDIVPDNSVFTVIVNGIEREVSIYSIGDWVSLITESDYPFSYGDIVLVSYTAPALNPLQGVDGGKVASFSDVPVTNNIEQP